MFKDISLLIDNNDKILILPHKSVDGDCLGSAYALKLALLKIGKMADVLYEKSELENRYVSIIADKEVVPFEPRLVIAVDCGDTDRLGTRIDCFNCAKNTVNIDHHGTNPKYADVNFVDASAAATGEIIFDLLQYMNIPIDNDIAKNLYIAIAADTGGFAYSNTTPKTLKTAAELIQYDIDFPYLCAYLFSTKTEKELMLAKEALANFETLADGKIASVTVTKEIIDKYGAKDSELGGLVDYPRSLDTAEIAFYFKEVDGGVKVSMRSVGADVDAIAKKFGGGGHIRASGCFMAKPLCQVKKILYDEALTIIGG